MSSARNPGQMVVSVELPEPKSVDGFLVAATVVLIPDPDDPASDFYPGKIRSVDRHGKELEIRFTHGEVVTVNQDKARMVVLAEPDFDEAFKFWYEDVHMREPR